ncbi:MAG: hypothetical protein CSA64_04780 [Arachnia propionica]|nr:MAG: hypothetical protein CSA64_04780 [Arachnia propionica]
MAQRIVTAPNWPQLVRALAAQLSSQPPGVFEAPQIVTPTSAAAKLLSQELALSLPSNISAGFSFLTPYAWEQRLADSLGLTQSYATWRGQGLSLAIRRELPELSSQHPLLQRHLQRAPTRRNLVLAARLAHLMRHYCDNFPELAESWLNGDDVAADGTALPASARWQPELLRLLHRRLGTTLVGIRSQLATALASNNSHWFGLAFVPPTLQQLIETAEQARVWHVAPTALPDWTLALSAPREELPGETTRPTVDFHAAYSANRQVEVLRDELTRLFQTDQSLEPRHVAIVVPELATWWPLLATAFVPDPSPTAHPGRFLRLPPPPQRNQNPVTEALLQLLRLKHSRANATQLLQLLGSPAVAPRWGFDDPDELAELVTRSNIWWGLDQATRSDYGLSGLGSNTWLRGLERLLTGIAQPPGDPWLPHPGVTGFDDSTLPLLGNLAEVVSRLRHFVATSPETAPVSQWRVVLAEAMDRLFGSSDQRDEAATRELLAGLPSSDDTNPVKLSAAEMAQLLAQAAQNQPSRPVAGNGSIQVFTPGEQLPIGYRVVCLLGLADQPAATLPDDVCADQPVPQPATLRRQTLLAHLQLAERALVIFAGLDPQPGTGPRDCSSCPATVAWLYQQCGSPRLHFHPPVAWAAANFRGETASFDENALAILRSLAGPAARGESISDRRRAALGLPVAELPLEVSVAELATFFHDPAREFLKHHYGLRLLSQEPVRDDFELAPNALASWGVRNRLLQDLRAGKTQPEAVQLERAREFIALNQPGLALIEEQAVVAARLAELEGKARQLAGELHRLSWRQGPLGLSGSLTVHQDTLIELTPGRLDGVLLTAWAKLLLLAQAGIPARAHLIGTASRYGRTNTTQLRLRAPSPDEAVNLLERLLRAVQLGRQRLLPLPEGPALQYLRRGPRDGGFDLEPTNFKAAWRFRSPHWEMFYDGRASELFTSGDAPPDLPASEHGAFGAWAQAIYQPILDAVI